MASEPSPGRGMGPLLVCTAINLYLLGGACLLLATSYPQLAEVGAGLPAFHASLSRRLALAFILPEFLAALSPLLLFWRRPANLSQGMVWLCLGLGMAWLVLTFTWHLPVQPLLAKGDASPEVMHTLLTSHAARTVLQAFKCGLLLWLVSRSSR
jgi:hypothetical protein